MQHTQQRKGSQLLPPSENEARAKLALYVYEYLCHNGAPKTAEAFRTEMQVQPESPTSTGPGFLYNCLFWDLYCATPDRKDKADPTQEAKAFYDMFPSNGIVPGAVNVSQQYPNMASMPYAPSNHAMDSNFYRPPQPGAASSTQASPVPVGYPNSFNAARFPHPMTRPGVPPHMNTFQQQHMFADPRMMAAPRMPMQRGMTFAPNMRGMRPMYSGYVDSPGTPTFAQNPMMQNGGPMNGPGASMMTSSGMPMPGMPDPNSHDPRYMMMPYGMMNDQCGMPSAPNGPPSVANNVGGPSSVGSGHGMPTSVGPQMEGPGVVNSSLSTLLNGDNGMDIKHSPSSQSMGMNGATPLGGPGSQNNGPGSVTGFPGGPGSAHSQGGAPSSVSNMGNAPPGSHAHTSQMTPTQTGENVILDFPSGGNGTIEGNDDGKEEEISKIKHSVLRERHQSGSVSPSLHLPPDVSGGSLIDEWIHPLSHF